MVKSFRKLVTVIFMSAVVFSSAYATPTTWSFSGTVWDGYADAGQTVTGSITIDLSSVPIVAASSTFSNGWQYYYPPYSNPLQVSGGATDGTMTASVGGGDHSETAVLGVYKGYDFGSGTYIDSFTLYISGDVSTISLITNAYTDGMNASGIFNNTDYVNPDLSLDQSVNWFSTGSSNYGSINNNSEFFTLNSMTITKASIPEPGTTALMGAALVGIAFIRRKRAIRRA